MPDLRSLKQKRRPAFMRAVLLVLGRGFDFGSRGVGLLAADGGFESLAWSKKQKSPREAGCFVWLRGQDLNL
ncbi:hypothetical protein EN828_00820 [Mesorhizobium sp. M2D.F.Ca.ET.185.01.1.1]|uniref:hypothetical protein n=1 Tax=unclassified Mesorhizobium TaxID=325217 RepID=UPI000FCAE31A|nr:MULTISPECIES: hypothetical protein [unclassified Mesorhizobium]TGP83179.1 hypothetical protein EN870_01120 [bacterium M00.F.Ca.ET.227.01.1.1]TGP99135.1 hypothetical protein EN864_05020 [bacterium M00.F.Ca.ET.221.01.1.1]TGP99865.1 hypothetical protein EN865_05020 [bacterium M00.F.Ca.ET.222.01.1.1]TGT94969.1 hypothetical protein EN806_54405 [bacterium M00.F.Ca.ET.163.01.1.1]TGU16362.1 hypothetical protein EN799_65625 [bacterium M00.F.Ca.ET.156.01.1.1]TGU51194.1 hypothetical protein EN789_007